MPAERPAILYVDDDEINLRVFEANFKQSFSVLTAGTAARALEIIRSDNHEIAVVLADQRMPGVTGVELLEQVRTLIPDAYRIMITAYSDLTAMMEAVNRGQIARYVVKPWVREELQLAIEDALRIYGLQAKLRDTELRMIKSAHLVAMGQVSAGIAHELMNPIAYVSQNLESLRRDLTGVRDYLAPLLEKQPNAEVSQTLEDLPHSLDDMEQGVKHIRRIAAGVKAQARGVDAQELADLREVVDLAVRMSNAEVRDRARITTQGEPFKVKIGPVSLCQVILNLIVNAAQALEGTGRKGLIQIEWGEAPEGVSCRITDNGSGIPPENLEKVFEPLFTTKAVGVGTGLGLSICRQLVEAAGGKVILTSRVGEGTTVELLLPRA